MRERDLPAKDTRPALVKHCDGKTWHFPGALFPLSEEEREQIAPPNNRVSGSASRQEDSDETVDDEPDGAGTDEEADDVAAIGHGGKGEGQQPYPIAAE